METAAWSDYLRVINSVRSGKPSNHQIRTQDQIEKAAVDAVDQGLDAIKTMGATGIPIKNMAILEIGPGQNFGPALLLAEQASRAIVADLYLAGWQPDYHPQVYQSMQQKLGRPSRRLDAVVAQNGYDGIIETLTEPAHDLKSIADETIDLIYSGAVLEHVHSLDKTADELFRVTRRGGYGVHQVDFRYHRTFDRPLEYLLLSSEEFEKLHWRTFGEIGCQTRAREAEDMFKKAGFDIIHIDNNMIASDNYMSDFMPRLRSSQVSAYREWPPSELSIISACFFLRKP